MKRVNLACASGPMSAPIVAVSSSGKLCVHNAIDGDGKTVRGCYRITHIESGLGFGQRFDDVPASLAKSEALAFMEAIDGDFWTKMTKDGNGNWGFWNPVVQNAFMVIYKDAQRRRDAGFFRRMGL